MYDIIIIGAGITGSMLARNLSQYRLKVAVLDKENDIADGATMANSAIVHTGYDPKDGTLKAKLNVEGARMYEQICADLGCAYKVVGAWIAACGKEEEETQEILRSRAERRGIEYTLLSGEEARKVEKNLSDHVTKVLSFPTTAVIYPWEVAIACMETAVKNGVELYLNHRVEGIDTKDGTYRIHCGNDTFETKLIINASGTGADKIARMVSDQVSYTITPRKGEYYVLDNDVNFVEHIIFPVPSAKGKGVLAVPTVYGNVLLGPNSDYESDPENKDNTAGGLSYVRENIGKTMKNVPFYKSIRTFAGLRPSSSSSDFVITEYEDAKGFIDVSSIESPGLASAPAIAKYVLDTYVSKELELKENPKAVMTRERPLVIKELSEEERNARISETPAYGKIICRCEQISEGEILDSIHRTCGATTVKGVKKRVRPGMGRCQGGFCEPRVVEILSRENKVSPCDVLLDGIGSNILESENR